MSVELPLLLVAAYLLGSVSFAVLFSRLGHLPDPRDIGSGNPGASNMLRLGNRPLAFATLICDIGKGAFAVWLAARSELGLFAQGLVGLAAVTGHVLPIYHHFRGGKGVAAAAGVMLMLSWPAALLAATLWLITFSVERMASLASLVASIGMLPWLAWHAPELLGPVSLMVGLILLRHRLNIGRLLDGTENRFKR